MIYLIDGIPTVGKSTLINSIIESDTVHVFREQEYGNPLDISRISIFTQEEFDIFYSSVKRVFREVYSDDYEEKIEIFDKSIERNRKWIFVHLNMLPFSNLKVCGVLTELMKFIPRNRFGNCQAYADFLIDIWKNFLGNIKGDEEFWFECVAFQSILYDLIGHYDINDDTLIDIYIPLINLWKSHCVKLIVMEVDDISESFIKAARERCHGTPTWEEGFLSWIEGSVYGQRYKLQGREGGVAFLNRMMDAENLILGLMPKSLYERKKRRINNNA